MSIIIKEIHVKTSIESGKNKISIPDEIVQGLKRSIIRDIESSNLHSHKKRKDR